MNSTSKRHELIHLTAVAFLGMMLRFVLFSFPRTSSSIVVSRGGKSKSGVYNVQFLVTFLMVVNQCEIC